MKPSRTTGIRATAASDDDPDERRDLEPADRGEDPIGSAGSGRWRASARLDDPDLASAAFLVDARAVAGHGVDRRPGEDRRQRARGRRVADPHLADPEQVDARRRASPATTSRPVAIASSASSRVIAGSSVMSAVPARTRALTSLPPRTGSGATSRDRPGDAGVDDHRPGPRPRRRATLIAAPRRRSWRPSGRSPRPDRPRRPGARRRGRPAATTIARAATGASARPVMPGELDDQPSSRPRLPGGFVSRSRRRPRRPSRPRRAARPLRGRTGVWPRGRSLRAHDPRGRP